ncbi:hypothetical protein OPT61_g2813 [Boeremia exigua]|uniref:Uncharacterized protein n=1 Tax=Boeremia exigua TaxID=749465 RepID=A0ACC2IK47_9PLEO|nr:hypothetical protein OPT61_g2813 [Boeremia exigua]
MKYGRTNIIDNGDEAVKIMPTPPGFVRSTRIPLAVARSQRWVEVHAWALSASPGVGSQPRRHEARYSFFEPATGTMALSMRLFLIRHGETVDNVAQLYAGSRDSALTNHGYQQATRLGQHFEAVGLEFTHLFSSHLHRAAKTCDLIRVAQLQPTGELESAHVVPEVKQLDILMEQDFGSLEGKKWTDINIELQNKPGFVAVETKEAIGRRADVFLDDHLLPLLDDTGCHDHHTVAVVSHGIFLSTLWKRLLRRLPAKSVALSPDLQSTTRPSLEHLGGWSNTGYLELLWTREDAWLDILQTAMSHSDNIEAVEIAQSRTRKCNVSTSPAKCAIAATPIPAARTTGLRIAHGSTTTVVTVNGKDHLRGLKRTRGGVGSSRHDASQSGIESFFKRRKVG